MDAKPSEFTFERSLPVREIAEELKRLNVGNRKAYLRFRSRFYTLAWRPLIPGAEPTLARAAMGVVQQLGGRVVRFAAGLHFVEVDILLPADVPVHKANVLVRRATSRAYKEKHKGIGCEASNGYLWNPTTTTQTMPPLLERTRREYETI